MSTQNAYDSDKPLSVTETNTDNPFDCKDCNIIFISLTSVRHDHMSMSGYQRQTSPNIDQFAKGAIIFDNAFSVASWTIPVINSLYTSQYPFTHNTMTRYTRETADEKGVKRRLWRKTKTFVDVLRNHGYATASINSGQDYLPVHGITNRFDYNRSFTTDNYTQWGRYGSMSDVAPAAVAWLNAHKNKKFFLHLQAYDAHCPYAFPQKNTMFDPAYKGNVDFTACFYNFDRRQPIVLKRNDVKKTYYSLLSEALGEGSLSLRSYNRQRLDERDIGHMMALYDGEIHNMDSQLAQVFQALNHLQLMDNTIIVLFSEHGELFGKHGRFMRGGPLRSTFYDDVLHVPLVLYHPNLPPRRVKSLVSLIDLAPTVLEMIGIKQPTTFHGQSFVSLIAREDPSRTIFAGSAFIPSPVMRVKNFFHHSTIVTTVRNNRMKLIQEILIFDKDHIEVAYELYNIQDDPEELENIASQHFPTLEVLNSKLNAWLAKTADLSHLFENDSFLLNSSQ